MGFNIISLKTDQGAFEIWKFGTKYKLAIRHSMKICYLTESNDLEYLLTLIA